MEVKDRSKRHKEENEDEKEEITILDIRLRDPLKYI
ncbi:hypothetical protein LCGC14_2504380, partial [marine sediment metagenome]